MAMDTLGRNITAYQIFAFLVKVHVIHPRFMLEQADEITCATDIGKWELVGFFERMAANDLKPGDVAIAWTLLMHLQRNGLSVLAHLEQQLSFLATTQIPAEIAEEFLGILNAEAPVGNALPNAPISFARLKQLLTAMQT